jgi:hypothetical protein
MDRWNAPSMLEEIGQSIPAATGSTPQMRPEYKRAARSVQRAKCRRELG